MKDYKRHFEKVIGYESIKEELYQQLDLLSYPEKYKELSGKLEKGIILVGQPGVGKTLIASCYIKAVEELGYKSFIVRKNLHDDKFIEYLNAVFDQAKLESKAIILLDDIDKYMSCQNNEVFSVLQTLIDEANESTVVIATCNNVYDIHKSLLRSGRLGYRINLDLPNKEDARSIIEYYLSDKKLANDVDIEEIRRYLDGNSIATLENVMNRAGVYAGYEKSDVINTQHILKAFLRVLYKTTPDFTKDDSKDLKAIATHEASHAVAMEILDPGSVTLLSVLKHGNKNTNVKGLTIYDRKESKGLTEASTMKHKVIAYLAGKVGTELFIGDEDAGCCADVTRAFSLLREYVNQNGSLDYSYSIEFDDDEIRDVDLLTRQDIAIQTMIKNYSIIARKILVANRELVMKLTDALLKQKTINYKQIAEIKSTCNVVEPELL